MANEIRANIDVRGEQVAAAKLKRVGDAAEKAGDALEDLGGQATDAGKSTEKAGDGFKAAGEDADFLAKRVRETTASVKALVAQLNATGDTSLLKDIRKARREQSQFANLAKLIAEPGKDAGVSLVQRLADGFRTGSAALKGAAVPALVGIAVTAAPAIGAAVGAAVLTGVGASGLGAGIALAFRDPVVTEAATGLGASLTEAFAGSADQFAAPLLKSFEILGDAGRQFAAQLNLNALAPLVTTLAKGLAGLGQNLLPGLNKALEASKPLLRIIANELPGIGSAISDFFSTISDESDGAGLALVSLLRGMQSAIRFSGDVIAFLSGIYEWSTKAVASISGFLEDALGWVPWLGSLWAGVNDDAEGALEALKRGKDASNDFAGGVKNIGESAEEAAQRISDLDNAISTLFDVTMGVEQANVAWARGMRDLKKELQDGARDLSLNTEAGIANREALDAQIEKANRIREANIAAKMPIEQANAKYQEQIDKIRDLAVKAGFARTEVDKFIAQWRSIPDEATKKFRFQVEVSGGTTLGAAMFRSQERRAEEVAGRRASGGPVSRGKTYWVGENGPELVTMGADGFVHSAADSKAMTSGASGGSAMGATGVQVIRLEIDIRGDDEDQVRRTRRLVKVFGGGNVQVAFGEN